MFLDGHMIAMEQNAPYICKILDFLEIWEKGGDLTSEELKNRQKVS